MVTPVGLRVAIVDDDRWIRTGRSTALAAAGVEVVAAFGHAAAIDAGADVWEGTDVALVDAWDQHAEFDHFPGVAVVEAIRRRRSPEQTRVVIVTGHVFNRMLRTRMLRAGADCVFSHADVADLPMLLAALLRSREPHARLNIDPGQGDPNAALNWVRAAGHAGAFDRESQKALETSRRAIMRIRREVGNRAGLPARDGSQFASWKQVVDYVNRARGAGRD